MTIGETVVKVNARSDMGNLLKRSVPVTLLYTKTPDGVEVLDYDVNPDDIRCFTLYEVERLLADAHELLLSSRPRTRRLRMRLLTILSQVGLVGVVAYVSAFCFFDWLTGKPEKPDVLPSHTNVFSAKERGQ